MRIYLDHQAATPLLPEAWEAMQPFLKDQFGNPSSLHQHGLLARDALAKARTQFAAFLNAESADDIIFTSTGTEAVNLAVKGAALANQRRGTHIVVSATEHPAVRGSIRWLEDLGFSATIVPVNSLGVIDVQAIVAALRPDTILICLHHANHDIGAIQPVMAVGQVAADRGITFLVDAVASAGWAELNVQAWGVGLVALSPQRFHGPKGVGVLYRHRRARLQSLIHGGVQEGGYRAGTENIPAIVGAGVAAEVAARELSRRSSHAATLQQRAWSGLPRSVARVRLNGPPLGPQRLPNNLNVSFEFVEGEGLALMLDMKGIAVAAGAACVTKEMRVPPVLAAIGLDESLARGNIILTFGKDNTSAEVDVLLDTVPKVVTRLREMSPLWEEFQRSNASAAEGQQLAQSQP